MASSLRPASLGLFGSWPLVASGDNLVRQCGHAPGRRLKDASRRCAAAVGAPSARWAVLDPTAGRGRWLATRLPPGALWLRPALVRASLVAGRALRPAPTWFASVGTRPAAA